MSGYSDFISKKIVFQTTVHGSKPVLNYKEIMPLKKIASPVSEDQKTGVKKQSFAIATAEKRKRTTSL